MNYTNQFDSYINGELKTDSIYRQQQPSNDFEIKVKKDNDFFYNEDEDRITEHLGTNYFFVYVLNRDTFQLADNADIGLTALNTDLKPLDNSLIEKDGFVPDVYYTVIFPATNRSISYLEENGEIEHDKDTSPVGLYIKELKD
ncbi:MAG: hypothetical protein ACK5MR_09915 [Cumulibacter sp.]